MLELLEHWTEITSFQSSLKPQSCHLSQPSTTLCILATSDVTRRNGMISHSNLQKRFANVGLWSGLSVGNCSTAHSSPKMFTLGPKTCSLFMLFTITAIYEKSSQAQTSDLDVQNLQLLLSMFSPDEKANFEQEIRNLVNQWLARKATGQ